MLNSNCHMALKFDIFGENMSDLCHLLCFAKTKVIK